MLEHASSPFSDRLKKRKCSVCAAETATVAAGETFVGRRRLKISAWREMNSNADAGIELTSSLNQLGDFFPFKHQRFEVRPAGSMSSVPLAFFYLTKLARRLRSRRSPFKSRDLVFNRMAAFLHLPQLDRVQTHHAGLAGSIEAWLSLCAADGSVGGGAFAPRYPNYARKPPCLRQRYLRSCLGIRVPCRLPLRMRVASLSMK